MRERQRRRSVFLSFFFCASRPLPLCAAASPRAAGSRDMDASAILPSAELRRPLLSAEAAEAGERASPVSPQWSFVRTPGAAEAHDDGGGAAGEYEEAAEAKEEGCSPVAAVMSLSSTSASGACPEVRCAARLSPAALSQSLELALWLCHTSFARWESSPPRGRCLSSIFSPTFL